MVKIVYIAFALLGYLSVIEQAEAQGFAPCHRDQELQGDGVSCQEVVIPPKLCQRCLPRPYERNGRFVNCKRVYFLNQGCRNELSRYARLNRCDARRNEYVQDFSIRANREQLDYFLYSVCEQCCDCIPIGSKEGEFDRRQSSGRLFQANRGNCGNHARIDLCKVWPNVKAVRSPFQGQTSNLRNIPAICPVIVQWRRDLGNPSAFVGEFRITPIPPAMRVFLNNYVTTARCGVRNVWEGCQRIEESQNRLSP